MRRVIFDFETRSRFDLKKGGAYKYSLDPTTQPTCLAFKAVGEPKMYFLDFEAINAEWYQLPRGFRDLWKGYILEGYEFTAHNAFFERCIYTNVLVARLGWPKIPARRYRCTAAKAAACALPRSLEGAGEALGLSIQKDRQGYNAMMATCKPTARYNAWTKATREIEAGKRVGQKKRDLAAQPEPPVFLEPHAAPEVWETLYTYCKIDVRAEEALDQALPDLIPEEQEIWHLNQKLNWRGLRVDVPTIEKIVTMMAEESHSKLKELDRLTMGLVTKPGARASILEFLALEGIELPNLQAKTVDDRLADFDISEDMRRLLEIRRALSMASTRKYQAFLDRVCDDGKIRDLVMYHGASTGRDAGTGINFYNFPRGLIKVDKNRPYQTVENVAALHPEMLRALYGNTLGILFSALLRNMLIPDPGKDLFVADFSKIEVAVLWWLADHEEGLELLRQGLDPYKDQAAANTGKTYDEITDEGDERQLGKAQILGAGFYMGWKRFKEAAFMMYRLKLTNRQALDAIKSYRTKHAPVTVLWSDYEDAAVEAIETGRTVKAGKCKFFMDGKFLRIELPSGRRLSYLSPTIIMKAVSYTALVQDSKGNDVEVERTSKPKKTVQILGLDKTKKKMQVEFMHAGLWTENIVQATARDLMMPALLRLEKSGYHVLLSVYDEGVCQADRGRGGVADFVERMTEVPEWGAGLPLEAKGWSGPRYRK